MADSTAKLLAPLPPGFETLYKTRSISFFRSVEKGDTARLGLKPQFVGVEGKNCPGSRLIFLLADVTDKKTPGLSSSFQ